MSSIVYCLNKDLTYPTEDKELPGNGAVVKIIEDNTKSIINSFELKVVYPNLLY